jgi:hypothetical protein
VRAEVEDRLVVGSSILGKLFHRVSFDVMLRRLPSRVALDLEACPLFLPCTSPFPV